jgi:LysR family transcriptional regulator, hypochlorite-specific transcription factor HypT
MDHKWLEDFLALARERSFSKAAETRHVTQPQFSRRIRALELWVGTDLVNRATVPLGLTPAGDELLQVARRTVSSLSDFRARMRVSREQLGWITLATGRTLSRTVVPQWLARTQRAVGDYRLRLVTGSIQEGVTALEQGSADFLLTYTHPRLPLMLDESEYESISLGLEELVAVSTPDAKGAPLHALPGSAKKPVRMLGYTPTLAMAQILQDHLQRQAKSVTAWHLHTVAESDFAESLHELARQGLGLAWLPRSLVQQDLLQGQLVAADPKGSAIRFEYRLYRARSGSHTLANKVWSAST